MDLEIGSFHLWKYARWVSDLSCCERRRREPVEVNMQERYEE